MNEILNIIHKTIYQFFDACEDDVEVPMSDKDKLLLEVNKAICNNLKALEKEPCEDAISRREAIKKFTYSYKGDRIPDYDCDNFPTQISFKDVKRWIRELPSVEPERKTGKWIENKWGEETCSECGYIHKAEGTNYCPNCGAKMEGGVNCNAED